MVANHSIATWQGIQNQKFHSMDKNINIASLLEILSFATSHYVTGMQLVVICKYLGDVCNYKFGIVKFFSHTVLCATKCVQHGHMSLK